VITQRTRSLGWALWLAACFHPVVVLADEDSAEPPLSVKMASTFYPQRFIETAQQNAAKYPWAKKLQADIVRRAGPWMELSDDQLWQLMFGPAITRSWDVWSAGFCPACKKKVMQYAWDFDVWKRPWKFTCPHCAAEFPKNDFHRFYRSGLNVHGVFDPQRADRTLLYNTEHPDRDDPLHGFGVDDGEGYVDDAGRRWRFVGTYLIYGQWKALVIDGIRRLGAAYVVTGNAAYAHKAGILLDRVADLYPEFDGTQVLAYNNPHGPGYVSTWHDACQETLTLAIAYDRVFEALRGDPELVRFLSQKAKSCQLENPKASFADIQRNIESRILRDVLKHSRKISCNFPMTSVTLTMTKAILDWPGSRSEVHTEIDSIVRRAAGVDGITGEKGICQYAAWPLTGFSIMLAEFDRLDPQFLPQLVADHPQIRDTYRFFIDLWCQGRQYYPNSGDSAGFAFRSRAYLPAMFQRPGRDVCRMTWWALTSRDDRAQWQIPSMYTLMWRLYQITGDVNFAKLIYAENDHHVGGLPWDLFSLNPAVVANEIAEVIEHQTSRFQVGSVNKQEWHLAVLRTGGEADCPEVWLDYDSGGGHGQADGMHLGIFAKGLDLLPDLGYPPYLYRHSDTPPEHGARLGYYVSTAGHNTVVVNGANTENATGQTTFWATGKRFHGMRCTATNMLGTKLFAADVLASQKGEMVPNGDCEQALAKWSTTGNAWGASQGWGSVTVSEGRTFAASRDGDKPSEKHVGTISQTVLCSKRYLEFRAAGWDRRGEASRNCFQISDNAGHVLKQITPPQSDHWQDVTIDLSRLGIEQGDSFTLTAIDGDDHDSYAWLAFDFVRQAETPFDLQRFNKKQFERTVLLVGLSDQDAYVLDIFRVIGGTDHAKFLRTHFGTMNSTGLNLQPDHGYEDHRSSFRNWRVDHSPRSGWMVDFKINDRYGYLPETADVHLRITDLTDKTAVSAAEGWIWTRYDGRNPLGCGQQEGWVPTLMLRRHGSRAPLSSTFVSVMEPYEKTSKIDRVRRLPLTSTAGTLYGESYVAVEIQLTDGRRDLLIVADVENPLGHQPAWQAGQEIIQRDWNVRLDGQLGWFRRNNQGHLDRLVLGNGQRIETSHLNWVCTEPVDFMEIALDDNSATVLSGSSRRIKQLTRNDQKIPIEKEER